MRHFAWLHAVPKIAKNDSNTKTRKQQFVEQGRVDMLEMPRLTEGQYILEIFLNSGRRCFNGEKYAPLTWAEIRAFDEGCGLQLTPWEFELIRRLSEAYVGMSARAESVKCEAPFMQDKAKTLEIMRKNVAKDLEAFFDKLDKSRK